MSQYILVVDDEEQIRELISIYLRKQGFEVASAGTSEATLASLRQRIPDLVVLDIGLADEDGLRLLVDIKKEQPSTKVIMLTGMGFVEDLLQEAVQKGADGYVSKVLPLDELMMAIQRARASPPKNCREPLSPAIHRQTCASQRTFFLARQIIPANSGTKPKLLRSPGIPEAA